jgi:hypothetical protein
MRQSRRRRWTDSENEMVLAAVDYDEILALKINRSVYAIQKQRERLLNAKQKGRNLESWEIKLMEAEQTKEHNTAK